MRRKEKTFDLERFRKTKNISQKEISEAVNLPQSFLSAIEHGKKVAPDSLIDELARIYNVDNISDYMVERKEPEDAKIQNVKEAMVNSKGLNINLNGMNSDTAAALISLLETFIAKDNGKTSNVSNSIPENNTATINLMASLLAKAEERYQEAQQKIKKLERENSELKSKLPKRKKQPTCN